MNACCARLNTRIAFSLRGLRTCAERTRVSKIVSILGLWRLCRQTMGLVHSRAMNRACKTALLGMLVMLGVKLGSHSQEQPKQQTPTSIEAGVKDSTQTPLKVGGKVSAPRIITAPQPEYSESARSRGYEGVCVLWLVVGTDGKPHDIRIARSLGLGLDEKAIEAVQQWRFEPAKRDGKAVAVQINVEVNFHLLGSDLEITNLIRNAERG